MPVSRDSRDPLVTAQFRESRSRDAFSRERSIESTEKNSYVQFREPRSRESEIKPAYELRSRSKSREQVMQ